jgi:hypothetical protein
MTYHTYSVSYRSWFRRYYACGHVMWGEAAGYAAYLLRTGRRGIRITEH